MDSTPTPILKYSKPPGFAGRGYGNTNWRLYKWSITVHGQFAGKYVSIKEMNNHLNLGLTNDRVWRIVTGRRVDHGRTNNANSFVSRYGHIKIEKINEYIDNVNSYDTRKIYAARCNSIINKHT